MSTNDSLLDVYIFENLQLLEQMEGLLLTGEKNASFSAEQIDALFRILHTIKGSSAMMGFDNLAKLSHKMEDLFAYLRENRPLEKDHRQICDLVFSAAEFIKLEMEKIQNTGNPDGDATQLIEQITVFYDQLKSGKPADIRIDTDIPLPTENKAREIIGRVYKAKIIFQAECKMETIRAFGVVKAVESICARVSVAPEDILNVFTDDEIIANGFTFYIESAEDAETLKKKISETFFIRKLEFSEVCEPKDKLIGYFVKNTKNGTASISALSNSSAPDTTTAHKQNYMSVKLEKLDKLMDLVGEIVITESTVTKNPEVMKLQLDGFEKAARQLRKLTDELQDIVMSIRMIPVSATFHKLELIVRDMCKKVKKQAELVISGEDTEIDKNVIDNLSDPLMHIIRNCMDHGIEPAEERIRKGKDPLGKICLDARNSGGEVILFISDDGRGLHKETLVKKGIEKGLIKKPESEVTDKEAYSLIFTPGFSTKEEVTEFSGRGVGMDVAMKNIEKMGGTLSVDSVPGQGMSVQIRIPLTLAIIDGMQVSVGDSIYILPMLSIKESFKPGPKEVFTDPDGNEMIMIRGSCYPVLRLNRLFDVKDSVTRFENGILVMVEGDSHTYCLFVDALLGEQQTVIKPMPTYISRAMGWIKSVAGCTILGNGNISLILDINGLIK